MIIQILALGPFILSYYPQAECVIDTVDKRNLSWA